MNRIGQAVKQEYPNCAQIIPDRVAGYTGSLEVTVKKDDGQEKLVHSKLKMGHGKAETEEELDALVEHINAGLRARAEARKQPSR